MKRLIFVAATFAIITIIFMTIYVIGQQSIRLSANLPQLEAAQDVAAQLNAGSQPKAITAALPKVDMAISSVGFVTIYDRSGDVAASSGRLDGTVPVIPMGVLTSTRQGSYNAVTWQPKTGVRLASVTVQSHQYYVVAARSLAEPEKLIGTIGRLTLFGYLASLVMAAVGFTLYQSVSGVSGAAPAAHRK